MDRNGGTPMKSHMRVRSRLGSQGQVTVEYFLLLAAIILISFITVNAFDDNVTTYFTDVATDFASDTITQDN
jgi:hypothetical protein